MKSIVSHLRRWLFRPGDPTITLGHATERYQKDMAR